MWLDQDYFNYCTGLTMTNDKFSDLFAHSARKPDELLTQFHIDVAASIQAVTEEIVLKLLQKRVNMRSADEIAVLNLGASGVNVSQQLERLRTLTTGPQDVVVFYDGTADAMQGLYYANFDGWIVGENRKHLDSFIARN